MNPRPPKPAPKAEPSSKPAPKAKPSPKPAPKAKPSSKPAPKAPPAPPRPNLAALVDGRALPEAEARELWLAFSVHMDEHVGDFDGFARSRGWTSVRPEHRKGQAVLVVATKA